MDSYDLPVKVSKWSTNGHDINNISQYLIKDLKMKKKQGILPYVAQLVGISISGPEVYFKRVLDNSALYVVSQRKPGFWDSYITPRSSINEIQAALTLDELNGGLQGKVFRTRGWKNRNKEIGHGRLTR